MNDVAPQEPRPDDGRTKAELHRSWWPGWIWAIPIAAVLLIAWWLLRTFLSGGQDITITFDDVHGLKASNSNVLYRGMVVGKVGEMELAKDGKSVKVSVHIDGNATRFLTSGTEFWLRGTSPSISNLSTLGSVVSGPTIIMAPGPGKPTTHYVGLTQQPVISGAHGPPELYGVSLSGAVGGLKPGQPVKLRGFTVGAIRDVGFRYDPKSGALSTPVTIALYPALFHVKDGALHAAVDRLIQEGLRAKLDRDPPVIGDPEVTLALEPGTPPAPGPQAVNGMPQIPADASGGIDSIVAKINKLPVEQIAQNVLDATQHADAIISSPHLKDAVGQLDATLAQLHQTADSTGPEIPKLVARLRQTAAQIDGAAQAAERTAKAAQHTVAAADRVVGGGAASQNDLETALREITEAARSVRALASYIDRHPEALIQGRSGP